MTGRVWVFGDDLNTDDMYPAFAMKTGSAEAARHVFYEVRPGWTDEVWTGDIVRGRPELRRRFLAPGRGAVRRARGGRLIAEEFNSLFLRNAVNAGLPALTLPGATSLFRDGDTAIVRPRRRHWRNDTTGASGAVPGLPDLILDIVACGGVMPRLAAQGYLPAELGDALRSSAVVDARRGQRCVMAIGRLLRNVRANPARSPLAGSGFSAPGTIVVASTAFTDGGAIPRRHAGKGVGDDESPELHWTGVPADAVSLLLVLDDVDVPLPKPLIHSVAVLEGTPTAIAEGEFRGYSGPRPIPGHGPHRYRFHVLALECPIPPDTTGIRAVLAAASGHVVARGTLTGTYERYASGISRSISSSHTRADMSDGARQSPRGDSAPPADTLGPLGSAERLNWLNE